MPIHKQVYLGLVFGLKIIFLKKFIPCKAATYLKKPLAVTISHFCKKQDIFAYGRRAAFWARFFQIRICESALAESEISMLAMATFFARFT
jgi:hypothetical protein